jgi:DNA gyrase inhibitor GyrI
MPFHTEEELAQWKRASGVRVRVEPSGEFCFVYRSVFSAHANPGLVEQYHAMQEWLKTRGTNAAGVVFVGMSQDDPAITPPEKSRYDLGIAFGRGADGLLGTIVRSRNGARLAEPPSRAECAEAGLIVRDFKSRELAVMRCAGDLGHVLRAWQYLYRIWLPSSAFEAADWPAMEMFVRLPEEIGWNTFEMEIAIPVVRR